MFCRCLQLVLVAMCVVRAFADPVSEFSGRRAYDYTQHIVAFGERTPGSPAHRRMEEYILKRLKADGALIESDRYTAATPRGSIPERNIIAKFGVPKTGGDGDHIILIAGHYETLFMPGFVGANDGGSSTGILLALADVLAHDTQLKAPVWLLFLDGEEAVKQWSATDGLYGSRHFAQKLTATGVVPHVRALLLLDMIGDKDLDIQRETYSTRWVQDFVATAASQLGYADKFFKAEMSVQDDHLPFLHASIPSVDLGDFTYGPTGPGSDAFGKYHHSRQDTMDKLSPESFAIVGKVVLKTVELLQSQG